VQKRALSRTGLAHDRYEFAGIDFEIEFLKQNQCAAGRLI
jgi:hypothetical protein